MSSQQDISPKKTWVGTPNKLLLLPTARPHPLLTLVVWMSHWVFMLYIFSFPKAGHCLGIGFLFFNSAHVFFHPLSVGLLVLLSHHCIVPAMISFTFMFLIASRLAGWSVCHATSKYFVFLQFLLPNISSGSIHTISRASPAHFSPWASSAHFIL